MKRVIDDPRRFALEQELKYVDPTAKGIERKRKGKGFCYLHADGRVVREKEERERCERLKIPPAWKDVWIAPDEISHIQATGLDARGRKQYIYHEKWRELASQKKFENLLSFSEALPSIRAKVEADIRIPQLSFERVMGTVIWIMEQTLIRVGNREYARENSHYGLTTLRDKHAKVDWKEVHFSFIGKSGKEQQVTISHPRIAKTVRECQELPGYELFQYIDEEGKRVDVDSTDVNEYLKRIAGRGISAKDFRTWGGTVLAASTLRAIGTFENQKQAKKNITKAIKTTASHLHNTPTITRNYYVHPKVTETYLAKELLPHFEKVEKRRENPPQGLDIFEFALQQLLNR